MRLNFVIIAIALIAPAVARADTTYSYTGNDFQYVSGSYTTSDYLQGSFTVASPLALDATTNLTTESFSFSDGVQTGSSAAGYTTSSFEVTTDSAGDIIDWYIAIGPPTGASFVSAMVTELTSGGAFEDEVVSGITSDFSSAEGVSDPGTWSVKSTAPVPEPSSIALLATGILGAAGVIRRRFAA